MSRRIRQGALVGLALLGGLLVAQAPASAAPAPDDHVVVADTPGAEAGVQAAGCRYGGWIRYSDGRVVHVYICD